MITVTTTEGSGVDAALLINLIDWLVTDVPITNTTPTSFEASGMFDGTSYFARVTGRDFVYTNVSGAEVLTGGIVDAIDFERDGSVIFSLTNVNIDMSVFAPIIAADLDGSDVTGIELFLMSQDWDITFSGADDVASADGLVGDMVAFNLVGNDRLDGGAGNDDLFAGDGDDTLLGGAGNDRLDGGSGTDIIRGGDGDDYIIGGNNSDELYGDAGNDTFYEASNVIGDFTEYFGGEGNDTLILDAVDTRIQNYSWRGGVQLDGVEIIEVRDSNDRGASFNLSFSANQVPLQEIRNDLPDVDMRVNIFMDNTSEVDLTNVSVIGETSRNSIRGDSSTETILSFGNDSTFISAAFGDDYVRGGRLADTILGEGGNDTLLGDVAIGLTGAEGQLYRAYQAVFGRDPDAAGFNAFMTEVRLGNADQVSIITEFVASAEFQATYGDLTNAEFVELLYTNVLPGNTDQQGRAAFTAALDNGALTRVDMVVEFANAPEFILNMVQGSAAFATNVIIDPSEAAVFRIYQAVFQRDPDAGGFDAFTGSLQGQILTVEQITAEFVASAEFQATYGDLTNAEFVELLYTNVLPGNTDQQGRANFTAALDNGSLTRAAMVAEFSQSFEFIQAQSDAASAFVRAGYAEAADTLDGGTGNDILFGGKGADIFVLSAGDDVVLDFTAGIDGLYLDAVSESASTILSRAEQVGADVRLTYEVSGQASSVTLRNVDLSDLSTSNFGTGASVKTSAAPAHTLPANTPIESYAIAADHGANYDSADYADLIDADVWV